MYSFIDYSSAAMACKELGSLVSEEIPDLGRGS
jgi:hypothetical protein